MKHKRLKGQEEEMAIGGGRGSSGFQHWPTLHVALHFASRSGGAPENGFLRCDVSQALTVQKSER